MPAIGWLTHERMKFAHYFQTQLLIFESSEFLFDNIDQVRLLFPFSIEFQRNHQRIDDNTLTYLQVSLLDDQS